MPSQYASVSKYKKLSVDMVGLSSDIFSDKAGSFLLLVLSPYMEDLQTLQESAGRINTFRNPILGHKDNAAFFCQNYICVFYGGYFCMETQLLGLAVPVKTLTGGV